MDRVNVGLEGDTCEQLLRLSRLPCGAGMNEPVSGSVQATDCPYTELSSKEGTKSDKKAPSLNLAMVVRGCRGVHASPISDYTLERTSNFPTDRNVWSDRATTLFRVEGACSDTCRVLETVACHQ